MFYYYQAGGKTMSEETKKKQGRQKAAIMPGHTAFIQKHWMKKNGRTFNRQQKLKDWTARLP